MHLTTSLAIILLSVLGGIAQFPPPYSGSPRPFGGRPFGGGLRGGPPPGGPRDGGVGRFLLPATRLCLRGCTAVNLACHVLPKERMTQTCKACLDSKCPLEGTPGFIQDRCAAAQYVECAKAGSCPAYTPADQLYFSNCLKCRDGCVPKNVKEQIQKRMKEMKSRVQGGNTCHDKCNQMHGCPKPAAKTCVDCVRQSCGNSPAFDCVQKAFGGVCSACKDQQTGVVPSIDVVTKCRQCKDACGSGGPRGGGPRGDGRRGDGDGRGDGQRDDRNDRSMDFIQYLPESVIVCLSSKCSTICPIQSRRAVSGSVSSTCKNCVAKLCPFTDSSAAFDLDDCRARAHASCGIQSGCTPFPADILATRNACTRCRDSCITDDVKKVVRSKLAAASTCRSNCVITSGCTKITPGACYDCIQKECDDSTDDDCRRNAVSSGKCSMCGSRDTARRAPDCLECLRKCGPDNDDRLGPQRGGRGEGRLYGGGGQGDRRPRGDGEPRPGNGDRRPGGPRGDGKRQGQRRLFGGDKDKPFLPVVSAQCIEGNCIKQDVCDDEDKTRDDRERLPQACRMCRSTLCPIKQGTPMFDNNKCRFEAHKKCGEFFGCKAPDAATMAKRQKCVSCVDNCIPETTKQQIRIQMMNARMCKDTCRDTKCGDKKQCQTCIDKICESSIYENCRITAVESCTTCGRNSQTTKQCDSCMDACMPAKPTAPMAPNPDMSGLSPVSGQPMMPVMTCEQKCESYGCNKAASVDACRKCIKSVCDDTVYINDCDQIVLENRICPDCYSQKTPTGYDCEKCYKDCKQ